MDESIDVADCLRRWKSGDEEAAATLIRHLYPVVCRIVRTHLSRRDHEEDQIQDVLMKTFARLHQYRAEVPLTHWVSRLAVTTCLDRLRANKIRPEIRRADLTREETDLFDAADWESRTKDAGETIEARDLVDKLLSILAPEDRSLILMVDLEGRSLEEISDLTGWGVSKIKMRLFRVRGQLRKTMQRLEKKNE
jgi:RNA polymerase sigma-70 factor (ECF subfamily)